MMKLTQRGALAGALAAAVVCAQHASAQTNADATTATNKTAAERSAELFPDAVIAKGKGFEIKRSKVDDAVVAYKANIAARGNGAPQMPPDLLEAKLLERLALTEILMSKATAEDKAKAKELTDKYIADAKQQFPSQELFEAQVKASGLTMDQFQSRVLEQNTCETVLEREVRSKITVSDAEAKKFYDENPAEFEQKEQVRASHILLSTVDQATQTPVSEEKKKEKEKLAKELKARAEKGEDFAKLAKEYSEDPGSKDKGGEYTFPRGQMVKEFETAAFSLQTNQVSDIVETRFGFHIIKLLEKIPAKTLEYTNVAPKLKDYLADKEFSTQLPTYLEKIKKESNLEILDEKLAKALAKREEETNAVAPKSEPAPASTNAPAPTK